MKLKVENFGKIKSACVNLDGYTIFVGDNNSGKTYLMQLIYGVLDSLKRIHFLKNNSLSKISTTELKKLINNWLREKKDDIVFYTFKKKIPIGLLELDFSEIEKIFSVKKVSKEEYRNRGNKESTFLQESDEDYKIFSIFENEKPIRTIFSLSDDSEFFFRNEMLRTAVGRILGIRNSFPEKNIFLPASRSGLMLTRPFVFANKNKEELLSAEDIQRARKKENELGLTQPVYDFLYFLQTHKSSENQYNKNSSLISFINKNIIHGEMKKNDNESVYKAEDSDEWLLPSYTSSMVNEISPIIQILTSVSVRRIQFIFYDEIETCQHPTTQIQMARLLNRMVNEGYKMVVSTHSDTMAAAINIAIAIEKLKKFENKLAEMGYEEEDILKKSDVVHAYQFIKREGGTTVEEVKRHPSIGLDFDFTLFNEANKKLFESYQYLK
jgi:hypothetical protein